MENINKVTCFKSLTNKTKFGVLTILEATNKISTQDSIRFGNKSLLANNVYNIDETYELIYTIIDTEGNEESYIEKDGILPNFFISPNNENYASIIPYHPDKELAISIPIFNREHIEIPKGNRPFLGNFIGISNQYSIFYHVDSFSKDKPDKLLAIEFKNNSIKKKHNIKIPLPGKNTIFVSDNQIHLLKTEASFWIHRQIDEKGNIIRERKIIHDIQYFDQILNLSFEEESRIVYHKDGQIFIAIINIEGKYSTKHLLDFEEDFYNIWPSEKIGKNTSVIRFTTGFGNGWFTIENENLLEFFYSKNVNGYQNLLTGEILEIKQDRIAISSINKTEDNNYLVVLYSMVTKNILILLNRKIQ